MRFFSKIKSLFSHLFLFWKYSKDVGKKLNRNRVLAYIDLVFCFIFYGADVDNYINFRFYRLNHRGRKEYLTKRLNSKLVNKYESEVERLFSNKVAFNRTFKSYIKRNWIEVNDSNEKDFISFVEKYSEAIIKPIGLCHGKGVQIVTPRTVAKFAGFVGLVEERIKNHEVISRLNPTSVNSIRVVTLLKKNLEVKVLCAILRIGKNKGILDNAKAGGISCLIDIDSGIIASNGWDFKGNEYVYHPVSHIHIMGYQMPKWNEVISLAKELATIDKRAKLVGWDIVVTPNHIELLEGNIPPGENIMQMFLKNGLKKDILSHFK